MEPHNVLVGDVWLCGGQSNMGLPLRFTKNGVWADARIEGNTIVVSSPAVPHPTQVRYAWQSNPAATLFNGAGLPAAPFRTDTWPGKTESARPY